jgi:DNA-binding XRE family transcriptional regulator
VPRKVLTVLQSEYGKALHVTADKEDRELLDIFETEAYREFKRNVKPGDYARIYRENAGLSQVELGEKLGVARSYICDVEHHRREISKHFAHLLADFFNVSVARFV